MRLAIWLRSSSFSLALLRALRASRLLLLIQSVFLLTSPACTLPTLPRTLGGEDEEEEGDDENSDEEILAPLLAWLAYWSWLLVWPWLWRSWPWMMEVRKAHLCSKEWRRKELTITATSTTALNTHDTYIGSITTLL